jgi:hypothetical protein
MGSTIMETATMTAGTIITVILSVILLAPLAAMIFAVFVPRETIVNALERFMMFVQVPFDFIRNWTRTILTYLWNMIKTGLISVGITREHWIQRTIGAILLTFTCLLGILVVMMNNALTLGGLFGSASETLSQLIPFEVELLIAVELIAAIFSSGAMLLDIAGYTHLNKFLSKETLNITTRWIFGIMLASVFIGGIYLSVLLGFVRTELMSGGPSNIQAEVENTDVQNIMLPNSVQKEDNLITIPEEDTPTQEVQEVNSSEKLLTQKIMTGIPVVSIVSGFFSGVGLITFAGMAIAVPFLCLELVLGLLYLVFSLLCRLIDFIYNFLLAIVNIFITAGQNIRDKRARKQNKTNAGVEAVSVQKETNTGAEAESTQSRIVVSNDNPETSEITQTPQAQDSKNIIHDDTGIDVINPPEDIDDYTPPNEPYAPDNTISSNPLA